MTIALWTARILAIAGFLDAAWLTASHLSGQTLSCGPGGGCELVLTSRYATIGGFPLAGLGVAYYAIATLIAWTPRDAWTKGVSRAFLALETGALFASAGLVWLQFARIHAWCRFCLFSASVTTLLFVCAVALTRAAADDPGSPPAD